MAPEADSFGSMSRDVDSEGRQWLDLYHDELEAMQDRRDQKHVDVNRRKSMRVSSKTMRLVRRELEEVSSEERSNFEGHGVASLVEPLLDRASCTDDDRSDCSSGSSRCLATVPHGKDRSAASPIYTVRGSEELQR